MTLRIDPQRVEDAAKELYIRALKKLPLWVDGRWTRERPVYAIPQEGLARDVGRQLPVWSAPCALSDREI